MFYSCTIIFVSWQVCVVNSCKEIVWSHWKITAASITWLPCCPLSRYLECLCSFFFTTPLGGVFSIPFLAVTFLVLLVRRPSPALFPNQVWEDKVVFGGRTFSRPNLRFFKNRSLQLHEALPLTVPSIVVGNGNGNREGLSTIEIGDTEFTKTTMLPPDAKQSMLHAQSLYFGRFA